MMSMCVASRSAVTESTSRNLAYSQVIIVYSGYICIMSCSFTNLADNGRNWWNYDVVSSRSTGTSCHEKPKCEEKLLSANSTPIWLQKSARSFELTQLKRITDKTLCSKLCLGKSQFQYRQLQFNVPFQISLTFLKAINCSIWISSSQLKLEFLTTYACHFNTIKVNDIFFTSIHSNNY